MCPEGNGFLSEVDRASFLAVLPLPAVAERFLIYTRALDTLRVVFLPAVYGSSLALTVIGLVCVAAADRGIFDVNSLYFACKRPRVQSDRARPGMCSLSCLA